MDIELTSSFRVSKKPCAERMVLNVPSLTVDSSACERNLEIGVFFDGTDNNMKRDSPGRGETNVARLYEIYEDQEEIGVGKIYVPGAGTCFPEIGEFIETKFGRAFGSGCHARILYALLRVINFISRAVDNKSMYNSEQLKAICADVSSSADKQILKGLGLHKPLIKDENNDGYQRSFLEDSVKKIGLLIEKSNVKVKEFFIDVFGFSRGAAEARVFCSWFYELTEQGKLAGIPIVFRFLGIFDTVASAGVIHCIGNAIVNSTDGHVGWAQSKFLRIGKYVRNCVHFVAMHEIRKNFPLDEVSKNGTIPSNCLEIAFPGSHSDVGGGYEPGKLGIACGEDRAEADSRKLSQIPLQHMLEYAISAGVPFSRILNERFVIHPDLKRAYLVFCELSNDQPKKLSEWMAPYLAWRWQVSKRYLELEHVKKSGNDKVWLIEGNTVLIFDAHAAYLRGDEKKAKFFSQIARLTKQFDLKKPEFRQDEISYLDPEAPYVIECAKTHPLISKELSYFFDNYIHDSYAGFRKDLGEPTGYWRYRRSFRGSNIPELTSTKSR